MSGNPDVVAGRGLDVQALREAVAQATGDVALRAALVPLAKRTAALGWWRESLLAAKRVRHIGQPGPADQRRVFATLRQLGRARVVERYVAWLARSTRAPGSAGARLLAFWAADRADLVGEVVRLELATLNVSRPRLAQRCAELSHNRRDMAMVVAIACGAAASGVARADQALRLGTLAMQAGAARPALQLAEVALAARPDDAQAAALLRDAADAVVPAGQPGPVPLAGPSSPDVVAIVRARLAAIGQHRRNITARSAVLFELLARWHGRVPLADAERLVAEAVQALQAPGAVFARYLLETGRPGDRIAWLRRLPPATLPPTAWVDWVGLAAAKREEVAMRIFADKVLAVGEPSHVRQMGLLLVDLGRSDEALDLWSRMTEATAMARQLGRLQVLRDAGRSAELLDEGLAAIAAALPAEALPAPDQVDLVALVRLVVGASLAARVPERPAALLTASPAAETDGAVTRWVRASLRGACLDGAGALRDLERARGLAIEPSLPLCIDHEIATLHMRYRRIGAARERLRDVATPSGPAAHHYASMRELIARVEEVSPGAIFYPECLIDVVVEAAAAVPAYRAASRCVATVTASLGQGGGERQTVTIVKALCDAAEVEGQDLLVRSVDGRFGFFYDFAAALPVTLAIYGMDWRRRTPVADVAALLPPDLRLHAAIDLLPNVVREDLLRLLPLFHARRPAAVHIRQDHYAPALAAALAGVPTFFTHRGSLALDTWAMTEIEREVTLRPVTHAYRRLLERTRFFLANNSEAGRQSDLAWLRPADEARLVVIRNAVDFAGLGDGGASHDTLRAALAIPPDAPVVGTIFRMEEVKRPLLWVDIAAEIAAARPDVHFVIAGGGRMEQAVADRAAALGVADRLHLPGPVADVGRWYGLMDMFLLTSEREGMPNVLVEAQHFGVPVVSADVGGARETFLPGVTGTAVAPDAPADVFAAAVLAILADPDWASVARREAPVHAHRTFGTAQAVERLVGLYRLGVGDA